MTAIQTVIQQALGQIGSSTGLKVDHVVGCTRREGGWALECEVLERPAIPNAMDVLGLYEFELDPKGNVEQFRRKSSRHRGDVLPEF